MTEFDGVTEQNIAKFISHWQSPPNNPCLEYLLRRESLMPHYRTTRLISWLYDFIRSNVKRGRIFDLREVLRIRNADCLGYAKLFTLLGRLLGLDTGVVEIVVDNKGRYVPHTAVLVRLENQRWRFVDLWYGSKNIKHRRVGLQVKRDRDWKIEDLELPELDNLEVRYLPDTCVLALRAVRRVTEKIEARQQRQLRLIFAPLFTYGTR